MNILELKDSLINSTSLCLMYDKNTLDRAFDLLKDAYVFYGGAKKAVINGDLIDADTEYCNDKLYIQSDFFSDEITKTVINNKSCCFAADALKKMNLNVVVDGRIIIAKKDDSVLFFRRKGNIGVNEFSEIAAYIVNFVPAGVDNDDICRTIAKRWAYQIVGDENSNDISDPVINEEIRCIELSSEYAMELFNDEPEKNNNQLFKGDYIQNFIDISMSCWYKYLICFTKAYGTYGSKYYKDRDLLNKIKFGLNWMYENKYGRGQFCDDPWGMISKLGWYEWSIAAPAQLFSIMMILYDELTLKEKINYTAFFDTLMEKPYGVGYNKLDTGRLMIGSAVLKNDVKQIKKLQNMLDEVFAFVDNNRPFSIETFLDEERRAYTETKGQGFYTDGSYLYHTLHGLNGMYGVSHFEKTADYLSLFQKTSLAPITPMINNVPLWIYNSFTPLLYQTAMFRTFQGRTNFPDCYMIGKRIILAMLQICDYFEEEDSKKIKSIIKYFVLSNKNIDFFMVKYHKKANFFDGIKLPYISKLREILHDDTAADINEDVSKCMYHIDKIVHKRKDWAFCISMSSSRIFNYDSICCEGMKNWYMGDGMTEYHIKNRFLNGSLDYWNYINYYKLPGVTLDNQIRKEISIAQGNEYLSHQDFVGGATLNNLYSVGAMALESYHSEKEIGKEYPPSIGNKNPIHKCDLTARKSWFMFDNEVVCIGTDINASDNNNAEVMTVIDNYLTADLNNAFSVDSKKYLDFFCGNAKTFKIKDGAGCYFPFGENICVSLVDNTYSGWNGGPSAKRMQTHDSLHFTEAWISHGINPMKRKYCYCLLPGIDEEGLIKYGENPDVEVIRYDSRVHAVKNKSLNISGYVFWEKTDFDGIKVSSPMIIIKKEFNNTIELAVSDPSQKLKTEHIIFDDNLELISSDECLCASVENSKTVLTIDFESSRGRSIEASFKVM
ncbi:MAG: hypothetical protein J6N52_09855 [Clostridia bacterium]|nr:hypothetical protein [Clostridia bacterium]